jgi:Protein of unknown function (DUF3072)
MNTGPSAPFFHLVDHPVRQRVSTPLAHAQFCSRSSVVKPHARRFALHLKVAASTGPKLLPSLGARHDGQKTQSFSENSNMEKDPGDWVTGDEPMTGAQRSYLKTLSEEEKEEFDESLSKADASKRFDELQARTGRGLAWRPASSWSTTS